MAIPLDRELKPGERYDPDSGQVFYSAAWIGVPPVAYLFRAEDGGSLRPTEPFTNTEAAAADLVSYLRSRSESHREASRVWGSRGNRNLAHYYDGRADELEELADAMEAGRFNA